MSTAWHLARSGVSAVLVTEGDSPVRRPAARSPGSIHSQSAVSPTTGCGWPASIATERWPRGTRSSDWLRFDGGLAWQPAEAEPLRARQRHEHAAHGYESHLLTGTRSPPRCLASTRAPIPATGAVWNPGEGWVDLPSLVQFLTKDLVAARRAAGDQRGPEPGRGTGGGA